VVYAYRENVVEALRAGLEGPADLAVDASAMATQPVLDGIEVLRAPSSVAGLKGGRPIANFVSDQLVRKELVVRAAWGVDYPCYRDAIRILKSVPARADGVASLSARLGRDGDPNPCTGGGRRKRDIGDDHSLTANTG
jgi:hypothetical protein